MHGRHLGAGGISPLLILMGRKFLDKEKPNKVTKK